MRHTYDTSVYEEFFESFHSELLPELEKVLTTTDPCRLYMDLVHPDLWNTFDLYIKYKAIPGVFKVQRLWVRNPKILSRLKDTACCEQDIEFYNNYLFLDIAMNAIDQFGIIKDGKIWNDMWFDNIGLFSSWAGHRFDDFKPKFGVYVKQGKSFAMLQANDSDDMFDRTDKFDHISPFLEYGLPHYHEKSQMYCGFHIDWVGNDIIGLDEYTRLLPDFNIYAHNYCGYYLAVKSYDGTWKTRDYLYLGKVREDLPEHYRAKEKTVEDFLEQWSKADEEGRQKLRDGLGYTI